MSDSAYIKIGVTQPERLEALARFVARLREVKQSGSFLPDEEWQPFFGEKDLAYFSNLTPDEIEEWRQDWNAAPVEQRQKDPSLSPQWDFGSFLDALKNGEFLLVGLQVSGGEAKLVFEPLAYPYGGPGCLIAIVEAFGQEVVGVEDGSGFAHYQKPRTWKPRAQRGL